MKSIFAIIAILFALNTQSVQASDNTINLDPDEHTFVMDTIMTTDMTQTVVYSIYKAGVKQPRTARVTITYKSLSIKTVMNDLYERSGYKTPRTLVTVTAVIKGQEDSQDVVLDNLYNYLFVSNALAELHIK